VVEKEDAMKNVAWILTRHHNLGQAAKILLRESKELGDAGLEAAADALLGLSGEVESAKLQLEIISLVLPVENQD